MRIISDFRDYYDSVQAAGQDRSLVYLRKPVEVRYSGPAPQEPYPFPVTEALRIAREYPDLYLKNFTVGFCGRIYPVILVDGSGTADSEAYCYNVEEVDAYVTTYFKDKHIESYHKKKKKWLYGREHWLFYFRREAVSSFFEEARAKQDSFKHIFEQYHCPVFLGEHQYHGWRSIDSSVTYNGCLSRVEFYRVMEPFTAFQEIAMWLGNQAEPRKPIPHIDDEVMLEVKGFNPKYSFRKPKTK